MNQTTILGHLGSDPETRFTAKGQKVTTFIVATNTFKAGKEETIWWRVTVWGERFDKMLVHLKKGSAVVVTGEIAKPEPYTNKEGRTTVTLELTAESIRFSPFGRGERNGQEQSSASLSQGRSKQPSLEQGFGEQTFGQGGYDSGQNFFGSELSSKMEEEEPPF